MSLWETPRPSAGTCGSSGGGRCPLQLPGKSQVITGDCPHTGAISSASGLLLLPLVLHILAEVQVITEGVAPAVHWTFNPELQPLAWDGGAGGAWGGQLVHRL